MKYLYVSWLLVCILSSCGDPCSRDVVQSVVSVDGMSKVTALIKNCGATTHFVVEVYIGDTDKKFDDGILIFRGEGETVKVNWKNSKTLDIITDTEDAKVIILMRRYFDVNFLLNGK